MKLRSLFLTILSATLLWSCQDAYEVQPGDEIADQNAITNISQLELALTGVYASIDGSSFIQWNALFTDEVSKNAQNAGQGVQIHTWTINSGVDEVASYYSGIYGTIRAVNVVLNKIDGITINGADEAAEKERVRAELLAIRAMCQFDLARYFTPSYEASSLATPIVDHYIVFDALPRNTWGEVIAYVEADLATAYSILSVQSDNSDVTRITPAGVQAIRARVALYNKEYDNARTYAQEVIDAFPLAQTAPEYLSIFTDASDIESVFKLKRVSTDTPLAVFQVNGVQYFNVSKDLYNQFTSGDVRKQAGVLIAPASTSSNLIVGKYANNATNNGIADIKLFRVAEMYLIKSEADVLKASPDLAEALTTLNALRKARRTNPAPSAHQVPDVTFDSPGDAITKILQERRRELCFEVHRFFDLKRFHLGVERLPADVTLNTFALSLSADSYLWTLPIPSPSIQYNSNLVQNPGY